MAHITVTKNDAIELFKNNMVLEEHYTFNELSNLLKENFKGINQSQISGLIHRLSSGKSSYLSKYTSIESNNYHYEINNSWNYKNDVMEHLEDTYLSVEDLNIVINKKLDKLIEDVNLLKSKANDIKSFEFIKNRMEDIEQLKQ